MSLKSIFRLNTERLNYTHDIHSKRDLFPEPLVNYYTYTCENNYECVKRGDKDKYVEMISYLSRILHEKGEVCYLDVDVSNYKDVYDPYNRSLDYLLDKEGIDHILMLTPQVGSIIVSYKNKTMDTPEITILDAHEYISWFKGDFISNKGVYFK